jgi:hypothetical protein
MTPTRRLFATILSGALLSTGLLGAATISAQADPAHGRDHTHLDTMGDRHVGEKIPIIGYLVNAGDAHDKNLVLQRKKDGAWKNVDRLMHRADGRFRFPARVIKAPQVTVWRVMVKSHGEVLHYSNKIVVHVLPAPVVPVA